MERILCAGDVIMIGARLSVEAGVEVGGDLPAAVHNDILRQEDIQLIYKVLQVFDRLAFEVGVEVAGIYACVGAAASGYGDVLFQLKADAFLEHLLHGDFARLDLPAVISLSVIRQM